MSEAPFRRRVVVWLVVVCSLSFLFGLVFSIFGPEIVPVESHGADAFSRSALGHRAFVRLLRRLDMPVSVSRHASGRKAERSGVLVVAEPRMHRFGDEERGRLHRMVERARRTLLVLPKWWGAESRKHPGWIDEVTLLKPSDVEKVAASVLSDDVAVRRVRSAGLRWGRNPLDAVPTWSSSRLQVLECGDLDPIVRLADGGILLGRSRENPRLYVLADPEPLGNAGLHRGENALFLLAVLDHIRKDGGGIVIDETLHGHEVVPSLWRELLTFPLVLVSLHVLLLLGVVVWAGMLRFGAPLRVPPPLEPGTHFLVENTARLLGHGRRAPAVLPGYVKATVRRVGRRLRAPPGCKGRELAAWLDRVGTRRGVRTSLSSVLAEADRAAGRPPRVLAAARHLYQWKQEILHGPD